MKENLQLIYTAQSVYIKLSDALFLQKLGQEFAYDSVCSRLKELVENLGKVREMTVTEDADDKDKELAVFFIDRLGHAVEKLYQIADRLGKKASGKSGYGWFVYRKDLKSLKQAQKEYQKLGVEMNRLFQRYA